MIKKFATSVALGAGLMWLADPQQGAQRRRRAKRLLSPALDAAAKLPTNASTGVADSLSATWARVRRRPAAPDVDITPDPTTITELVDLARANGVHGAMDIADDRIMCTSCGAVSDVESVERLWLHRFEGATDPDDMSTVSALRCPVCSTVGLLITGYGPNASPEESDVIVRLQSPQDSGMAPFLTARS